MAEKKVIRIRPKATKKPKKTRRPPGQLERCGQCPMEQSGWKRSQVKWRRRLPLCFEHAAEFDETHQPWPSCPKCGGDEWGIMRWGGSVESTIAFCGECGYEDRALNHFDAITIKLTASPIERPEGLLDLKPGEKLLIVDKDPT